MRDYETLHAFLTDKYLECRYAEHWQKFPMIWDRFKTVDQFLDDIFFPDTIVWCMSNAVTRLVENIMTVSFDGHMSLVKPVGYVVDAMKDFDFYKVTRKIDGAKMEIKTVGKLGAWGIESFRPVDLESAMSRYQDIFKIRFGYDKSKQATWVFERKRKGIVGDRARVEIEQGFDPFLPNVSDLKFYRNLSAIEAKKNRLIALDKINAYPTACSIKLGVANYQYRRAPQWEGKAGVYRIKTNYRQKAKQTPMLPVLDLKGRRRDADRLDWFDAPTLRLLSNFQIPFEIIEAYIFTEETAVLDSWARSMREEMAKLTDEPADKALRRLIKTTANVTIGVFGKENDNDWFRPDWRGAVIREHCARMQRDILSVEYLGIYPVAVETDCLYFAVDESEMADFPFLADERLSGKYRLEGVWDLSEKAAKRLLTPENDSLKTKLQPYKIEK
jgi:hypothetical protein